MHGAGLGAAGIVGHANTRCGPCEFQYQRDLYCINYYLARRSLCEIINSTLGMLIHRWIGGTLFRTCITLKSKQRENGASESPCFSQMRSEMRLRSVPARPPKVIQKAIFNNIQSESCDEVEIAA